MTAALLASLAVWILPGREATRARRRWDVPSARLVRTVPVSRRPLVLAAASAATAAVLVGGATGLAAGLLVGAATAAVVARRESPQARRHRLARAAALPGVLDLLAVCLRAGLPTGQALGLVATTAAPALGGDLAVVAAAHELGSGSPWAGYVNDPVLGPVARAVRRVADSGSALAAAFEALAESCRADLRLAAESAARRVAVFVLAPLGLCFLPAFVCLGVVPIVIGVASDVLG